MDSTSQQISPELQEYDTSEILTDPTKAAELAAKDLNFLAGLCLMEQMLYFFPAMFIVMWKFITERAHLARDFSQLALGIPRGFAKTTLMKIYVVYCILFTRKRFILIVANNEEHSINIVRDACEMLQSPNILNLFGDYRTNIERDTQQVKILKFRTRRIIIAGMGANGSIRGLNLGNERPDIMIFEDYQSKEDSENDVLAEKQYKKMLGSIMKACSPFGCLFIYVGNMYPTTGCILRKLKKNPDWISLIVGAILEDGTSLWEELQPIDQLIAEYEKDLRADAAEVFLAEKLNDENAGLKAGVDITKLPRFPHDNDEIPQGRAIVIDPALDNPKSDYNGVGLVGLFDGIPCLEKVLLQKFTPLGLIKAAIIMAVQHNCKLITVENAAYQASLLFWFNKICEDNQVEGFHFQPLNITSKAKNARIKDFLREWVAKEVYIKDEVRPFIVNEVIKWDPLKTKNQDTCLDLGVMCKKVVEQYSDLMLMQEEPAMLAIQNLAPLSVEENCPF